jgi:hypothetical protein
VASDRVRRQHADDRCDQRRSRRHEDRLRRGRLVACACTNVGCRERPAGRDRDLMTKVVGDWVPSPRRGAGSGSEGGEKTQEGECEAPHDVSI